MKQFAFLVLLAFFSVEGVEGGTLQVDLVNSSLSASPGGTVQVFGTITNVSATDTIYLNGVSSTGASALLTINTLPFYLNAPLFLAPNSASQLIELFDVTIDPAAATGGYLGNTVSIAGGADGGTNTAFGDLADISFDVQVGATTADAPEPGTFGMLCVGGLLVYGLRRLAGGETTLARN